MTYESNRQNDDQQGPKVFFVEAEKWEHERLVEGCHGDCNVASTEKLLGEVGDDEIPDDVVVLSPFVHSEVTQEQIDRFPDLRLIATRSTGFDHIDVETCNQRGILVANVPHYGENTVAEHAFALILALTRKIHRTHERTIRGDFSIEGLRGIDLQGRTFGALGAGNIAQHALRIAGGFGMRRIAFDVKPDPVLSGVVGFEYVDFDKLLAESDILSIHVPHNEHTHHMIDTEEFGKMKDGAILINTARGGIVNPQALLDALKDGKLGGAGLDVLEAEGIIGEEAEILSRAFDMEKLQAVVQSHAMLRMPNVIITPHMAFNSEEAVQRIVDTTLENIRAFHRGKPRNIVNHQAEAKARQREKEKQTQE